MLASNTAQVLTSLVEASVELKTSGDNKVLIPALSHAQGVIIHAV